MSSLLLSENEGGNDGGGGAGIPLGALVETQANVPDLPGFRRINNRVQLSQTEFEPLFAAVGTVADNAPFVNASAPINNSAIFREPDEWDAQGGNPDALKKVGDGDLWMLRKSAQLWYSTTGIDGPYTQSGSFSASAPSNTYNKSFDYANGFVVAVKANGAEVTVNAVADDFEGAWSTFLLPGLNTNARAFTVEVINGFWMVKLFSHYYTNAGWLYVATCPITSNPAIVGNWSLSNNLINKTQQYGADANRTGRIFYDPVDDIFVWHNGHWDTVADVKYRWVHTAPGNDPTTWTRNDDFNTQYGYEVSNSRQDASFGFTTPDGIRWLFATEASNYVYAYRFDNGYAAAPTDRVYVRNPAVSNGNGSNGPPPPYGFTPDIPPIPLIHDGWSFLVWNSDRIYRIEWNGADWNFYGANDDFRILYGSSEFSDNNNIRGARFYDEAAQRFTTVGRFNPASSNDWIIWDYPFFTYDKETDFALLPVTHANDLMVYQVRVE